MRVLLLSPPYVKGFMRNARWDVMGISGSQWYPIYLAYCAGLLERSGHEVKLLDAQVDKLTHEETYQKVQEFMPELTVISYSNKVIDNDLEVATCIRNNTNSQIVFVGASSSTTAEQVVQETSGNILAAKGEYDYIVLDLANKVPLQQVNGLVWYDKQVCQNPPREPVTAEQLDTFPFVTDVYRRHLHVKNYGMTFLSLPYIDMFAGRGCCWGNCTFCLFPNTINKGAGYRGRQLSNVIEELKFVKSEMSYIKEVFFQDDAMPEARLAELSELILENNIKMRWSSYSRANLRYDTLKLMKRSGCNVLNVGYESSNPEILRTIKKGVSVDTMTRFTHDAINVGLYIVADLITGLPGETVETIKATVDWAKRLPVQRYTITLPKPYPMTPYYEYLEEHGYLKEGKPNYPTLSTEDIEKWNKWSLRQCYLTPRYFFRMLFQPSDWGRIMRTIKYALPYFLNSEQNKELEW